MVDWYEVILQTAEGAVLSAVVKPGSQDPERWKNEGKKDRMTEFRRMRAWVCVLCRM